MSNQERVADGEQAQAALDRFLNPAFEGVMAVYREGIESIAAAPWDKYTSTKLEKLATALKVATEVRKQIESVALDGKLALDAIRRDSKIQNMTTARKHVLGIPV